MNTTEQTVQDDGYPKSASFTVLTPQRYRWAKYKPDGQRQMKAEGRWQKEVWHGDYFKWENCEEPAKGLQIVGPSPATPSPDYRALLDMAVEALGKLLALNDNHSPFGGEIYQDRVDRAWDAARSTLATIKQKLEGEDA